MTLRADFSKIFPSRASEPTWQSSRALARLRLSSDLRLQQIRQELLDSQRKVASLQDMALQLLVNSQSGDCLEAKEKVHVIGNRLKLLLKEVTRDLRELARILDMTSSQQVHQIRVPRRVPKNGRVQMTTFRFAIIFEVQFEFCVLCFPRICHLGRLRMIWTRDPARSVPPRGGALRVGGDR